MKLIHRDVFREIRKSTGRFVSLFLIVALGVAFYAGIRSCNPDMLISADNFYDASKMEDLRIISTLGLTDDDIDALEEIDGVEKAFGTYTADFISHTSDAQSVIKLMALTEGINEVVVEDGRMPENKNECLIDNYYIQFHGYKIGDELEVFADDGSDISDTLNTTKFKIVGSFVSSQYLSHKRGTTSVGSGKLDGLAVVLPEVFNPDYYTEIDIIAKGAKELLCYSDEYENLIDELEDKIEDISDERCQARYDEIKGEAQEKIDEAQRTLDENKAKLADAQEEYDENEQKLAAVKTGLENLKAELENAKQEIEAAQAEADKIEMPEWYVLNRNYLSEYSSYQSDAERIGNIGKVFPIIFFIVAAMVCLTTMTRMVDEERTQIGTYKALGYSKGTIISKFIVYALIATVAGSIAGALIGSKILPMVIINVYKLMYPSLMYIVYPYNLEHCLTASIAALVCILGATLLASVKTLLEEPASLMRPVSPKQGKKLLIERITALWRRIPFTWKNALRNFVRYKKRLFMTLFGIVGSTALLLVGFGLKDAVNTILYAQYGEIYKYNEVISLDTSASDDELKDLETALDNDENFAFYERIYQSTFSAESAANKGNLDVYLLVPENVSDIGNIIDLHNRVTKEHLPMDNDSVIISEKMAKVLSLNVGDTFEISVNHENAKTLTVGGIAEHYVYNYIYMTPDLYENLFGETPEYNELVIVNNDGVSVDETEFGNKYMKYDAVGGVMSVESLKESFADMLKSMDSITLVLIICAGALTFVVLFNLNNINIRERSRELATLKVLGFYDIELSQYIYRENVLITIIGVALGVLGGYFLNEFVVSTVEVDIVMFGREIYGASYLKSILIAVGFTVIVNIIVHFKLKKIDMASSLKSVE